MNRLQNTIQILLFCLFPLRFLIQWLPILGFPFIATLLVLIEYICFAFLMMHSITMQRTYSGLWAFRLFQTLYWIYSAYLVYYIIIDPQLTREIMLHVPTSNITLFQSIITIALACSIVTMYQEFVDYNMFVKISTLFLTFLIILHNLKGNMSVYLITGMAVDVDEKLDLIQQYRMLDGFTLADFSAQTFLFNLWLKDNWTKNPLYNGLIFWSITFVTVLTILFVSQRGPLLFLFITVVFFYYCRGKLGIKVFGAAIALTCAIITFKDELISFFSRHSLPIVERYFSIIDDGGSGRFGSSESEYALAWRQIADGPFFGTYFRTLLGTRVGNYPHNFILELMMTFGVVFTIPFLLLLWYGIKNCMYAIRNNLEISAFGLFFLFVFLQSLTSGTLVLNTGAWVSMAMVICVNNEDNENDEDDDGENNDDNEDE